MDRDAIIAALIFGGSGSGSGLPDVTSSDNGKSLKVVSGAWAAAEDEFVVTFTKNGSVWSADKLLTEISDAISAQQRVYGKVAASLVSSNSAFSGQTFRIPLSLGTTTWSNGYQFSGAYQTGTTTLFVNIIMALVPPLNQTVTAYIKEIELAPAPLVVNYTITGQPVDGVYPLSADKTLAEMQAAKTAGREIKAVLTTLDGTLELPLISTGANFAAFSNVTQYNGEWVIFQIATNNNGVSDASSGAVIPISTAQMSYDSGTGTLAITE